ncbi:SDR family NAD(P)-dependent oxidoreductase [Paenibacillus sp. ALJ109b]|uniref:SDR family NAD(P)-dependent oxidoreductase n=1 Tax=Paenibacillus sp. ALJ109b TaxID=2709068 RepID=UPI0013D05DF6|nr:SDR family NAD(P)-dependent oxidoreductase [Paenibacillus sp. ALJ109b]NEU59411.1 SDR family oxidoreductase [Paenibacillus sp. ALJ109b]
MPERTFAGKRVVITGAAGVFGQWIAQAYAAEGASLYLSDIREDALRNTVNKLKQEGVDVHWHVTNLVDEQSINELVQAVEQQWKAPDIVINNAGIYPYRTLMNMTLQHWNETMDLNLAAPFLLTQHFAKQMIASKVEGSFINISSGAASTAGVGMGNYSVSKVGIEMLTKTFALELSPYRIRVNAVVPGYAPGSEVSVMTKEHTEHMINITPLGRTSGPDDAPQAILYLTSDQASFITGSILTVDGGRTAGRLK